MKNLYLNPATRDLDFDGQNNLVIVDGDDEFLQCLYEILRTNSGEWFLNKGHGFNRFAILGNKYELERAIDTIYAALFQETRVKSVESINLDYDRPKRELSIDFVVTKTDGQTIAGGVVV